VQKSIELVKTKQKEQEQFSMAKLQV
jgi:hypothetical protein